MKRKLKLPKTDRLIGLSAMLISLLTLIIFVYQTNIISKQSKLSVKPRLSFSSSETTIDSLVIFEQSITNKGLGPAIVNTANIVFEGKTYPLDFGTFVFEKFDKLETLGILRQTSGLDNGTTLSPNDRIVIFEFEAPLKNVPQIIKYLKLNPENYDPQWNFHLKYSSIYEDEKWVVDDKINLPKREK
ncbi:hypothetical protein [Gilvibacter sediminis]|uniref:hypothetical protein n=1 Tax=Gilvibacter sediminis TaxID=379071 RepID=UPI002350A3B3|nr:hypothetical protein [Gilvibacter sediminis]MDC7998382.1 hypothetical protein [Gilvibacter sediminis]